MSVATKHLTVGVAATTVTLNTGATGIPGRTWRVTVTNRDAAGEVFFTTDGATPTAEGDDTNAVVKVLGAATTVPAVAAANGDVTVKLIATVATKATVAVSVNP